VLAEVRSAGRVWRGASGVAELGTSSPVPVAGRFRVGSVTKSFVATVVLQLVGAGRTALDDTVEKWLPGIIPDGDRITLRHLLQHTSGIVDYGESNPFRSFYGTTEAIVGMRHRTWTAPELLAFVAGQPSLFEPGSSWAYSSTNYLLLGLVVERVTGNSYATEVERRILRPLDLPDTEVPGANPHIAGPHLHGYLRDAGREPVDITEFDHSFAGAAGELVSSAADLNRFYCALMTGGLLAPAQLAEMRTVRAAGDGFDYGLGIATRQLPDGTTLWGHNGGTFGFETFSWTTGEGGCQVTVAVTSWADSNLHARVNDFLTAAFRQSSFGADAFAADRPDSSEEHAGTEVLSQVSPLGSVV
jgi:D-alanyl-D-alanine carboxypeptidase